MHSKERAIKVQALCQMEQKHTLEKEQPFIKDAAGGGQAIGHKS